MRSNKDHHVLAIKDFQDKDYEDLLKQPALCHKKGHRKEELKFFCKNCESAVCQICVTLEHGGHALSLIEEGAERQKIQMKFLKAKENIIRQLDEDYGKLIQQGEDAKRECSKNAVPKCVMPGSRERSEMDKMPGSQKFSQNIH